MKILNTALGRLPEKYTSLITNKLFKFIFTKHAILACVNDRYGVIHPPKSISLTEKDIVEIEVENGHVDKVVARIPYDDFSDLIMVFIPEIGIGEGIVKTVWKNDKNDKHSTLKLLHSRRH